MGKSWGRPGKGLGKVSGKAREALGKPGKLWEARQAQERGLVSCPPALLTPWRLAGTTGRAGAARHSPGAAASQRPVGPVAGGSQAPSSVKFYLVAEIVAQFAKSNLQKVPHNDKVVLSGRPDALFCQRRLNGRLQLPDLAVVLFLESLILLPVQEIVDALARQDEAQKPLAASGKAAEAAHLPLAADELIAQVLGDMACAGIPRLVLQGLTGLLHNDADELKLAPADEVVLLVECARCHIYVLAVLHYCLSGPGFGR